MNFSADKTASHSSPCQVSLFLIKKKTKKKNKLYANKVKAGAYVSNRRFQRVQRENFPLRQADGPRIRNGASKYLRSHPGPTLSVNFSLTPKSSRLLPRSRAFDCFQTMKPTGAVSVCISHRWPALEASPPRVWQSMFKALAYSFFFFFAGGGGGGYYFFPPRCQEVQPIKHGFLSTGTFLLRKQRLKTLVLLWAVQRCRRQFKRRRAQKLDVIKSNNGKKNRKSLLCGHAGNKNSSEQPTWMRERAKDVFYLFACLLVFVFFS